MIIEVIRQSRTLLDQTIIDGMEDKERVYESLDTEIVVTKQEHQKQMEQVQMLWKECFHEEDSYMDFYFRWKTEDNTIYVIKDLEQIVSMVHCNPYSLRIGSQKINSYYIVGVATDISHRKQGLMRKLLQHSLIKMKKENVPFTYLMPASERIYLPFDFCTVTSQRRYMASLFEEMEQVTDNNQFKMSDKEIWLKPLNVNDTMELEQLSMFANQMLGKTEQITTLRDSYYYRRMNAEMQSAGGAVELFYRGREFLGYVAYMIEEKHIEVIELMCEESIQQQLLDALQRRKHASKFIKEDKKAPLIMVRIVDLFEFFSLVNCKEEISLLWHVTDSIVDSNTGVYQLNTVHSKLCATKVRPDTCVKEKIELSTDIATLTQFFFGMITVKEILQTQNMRNYDEESILKKKLSNIVTYTDIYMNEIV